MAHIFGARVAPAMAERYAALVRELVLDRRPDRDQSFLTQQFTAAAAGQEKGLRRVLLA